MSSTISDLEKEIESMSPEAQEVMASAAILGFAEESVKQVKMLSAILGGGEEAEQFTSPILEYFEAIIDTCNKELERLGMLEKEPDHG